MEVALGSFDSIEELIQVARTPEEVWAVVGDPENDPYWCRKVKSAEPAGESRVVVTHKPVPLRPAMGLVVEGVVADQPRRLSLLLVQNRYSECPAASRASARLI